MDRISESREPKKALILILSNPFHPEYPVSFSDV